MYAIMRKEVSYAEEEAVLPIDKLNDYFPITEKKHVIDNSLSLSGYLLSSKEKIRPQSFFMLTTCHSPDWAAFSEALSFSA